MTLLEFESQVSFSLTKLARLAGVERRRLIRLLESGGVTVARSGNRRVVYRADLRDTMPTLYAGLLSKIAPREDL